VERRRPADRKVRGRAASVTAPRATTPRAADAAHRLVLWDIDGTLLTTGPAGRAALEEGVRRAAGLVEVPQVVMGGKTDPQILKEILAASGMDDARIERVMPDALFEVERVLAAHAGRIRSEGRVHPGVRELLAALAATPGVRQSLLTGNIAPNARVKVAAFGLGEYFDFEVGAYGTDHAARDRLVPIALARARELRGERYRRDEVWIIGDTAHDLSCARAGGVRALIVGTGHDGFDAVSALDADALVEDLSDTDAVLKVLLGP
jgi:phosphoglycolate phosphatase